jgi:hypothetical protein
MSSESFAMTRKTMGPELARLAEEHMKHEYEDLATHTRIGALLTT